MNPLPPLPTPESGCAPAPYLQSFRRELPDISSRQEVHHRLIALFHGKQLLRSARGGISLLSSPSPLPLLSRGHFAGLSTGCNGGRGAPASGPLSLCTTSICRPLGG